MKIAWLSPLLGLFGSSLLPAIAAAQPVTQPADIAANGEQRVGLGIEVLAPDGDIDAQIIREAIANDLGIAVTDGSAFAPSLGRLEIAADRGVLRIAYHPAAGTVIERTLQLPIAPDERIQLITFVAANLVRDQAKEIIDGLPPAPVVVIPPITPPGARPASPPTRFLPATIGIIPPLSVDRAFGERVEVGFGLHALVGMTTASRFASISGVADIQREYASGAQIGGVAAVAGSVDGGVQIGGVAAVSRGDVFGVQIGGVGSVAKGHVRGAQIGGVATASQSIYGAQIAGVVSASKHVDGIQISGVGNVASSVDGVQIGGVANVGGDVNGLQIGVVNVAKKMRGVQIGVVNLSDDGDDAVPIGIINYSKNGGLAAEGWVDSSRVSAVGFRHGTKHVHNIWALGWSPDYDHLMVGAGIGVTFGLAPGLAMDVDGMQWFTKVWKGNLSQIAQARVSLAAKVGQMEVFGGIAANVYTADGMDESESFHPVYERRSSESDGDAVVLWPSAFAGIRLRAR